MLKQIHQNRFLIATVLIAALAFFFLHRLSSGPVNMSDMAGLIVCCALFGWTALKDLERKLNGWVEPKMGSTLGSSLVGVQRSNRNDLEHSLVHALAPHLVSRSRADDLGKYIREAADAIEGDKQNFRPDSPIVLLDSVVGCTVPPHQQRVLDEKQELDIRITRLDEFILRNALFRQLDPEEQARLRRQLDVMRELSVILGERISAF